jgi:hypothetical protein
MAWDERTKCLAACSVVGWMTVNCRWCLLEWPCHIELVVFRRFGQWTATNPFTPQGSMAFVGVWLGVQTGNQRTTREWTRPGNRPTISFWLLGELINGPATDGSTFWKMGLNKRIDWMLDPLFYIFLEANSLIFFFSRKKSKKNG